MLNELNTYTLQELYKQPIEPISWLVEGLLAPGLYFLGGSPKVGKSWLALQLCLAVSRGEPFLGFKTRWNEVLYIALEDGSRKLIDWIPVYLLRCLCHQRYITVRIVCPPWKRGRAPELEQSLR